MSTKYELLLYLHKGLTQGTIYDKLLEHGLTQNDYTIEPITVINPQVIKMYFYSEDDYKKAANISF